MELLLSDWVFGYGSLIWNPEVDYERAEQARVHGFHRAFCISSTRHRGTPQVPGVVLGLDRGGSCIGVAFRLRRATRRQSIEKLYDREMQNRVYLPKLVGTTLHDGRQIRALAFVADRSSKAYLRLTEAEILQRLSGCRGQRGHNRDYALNTWHALQERGVHDARLARLAHQLLSMHLP